MASTDHSARSGSPLPDVPRRATRLDSRQERAGRSADSALVYGMQLVIAQQTRELDALRQALSPDQLDGLACVRCGGQGGAMVPIPGTTPQLFAHAVCPTPAEPLMTTAEIARLLGVSPGSIRAWADAGQLSSIALPGGERRFSMAAVDALLAACEQRSAT
jgi:excisionase family DNA binding protein